MLTVLSEVMMEALPALIQDRAIWKSLAITYEKPHVARLYTSWKDRYRIALHRIEMCRDDEAFLHPHPAPSAVILLRGGYRMRLGRGKGAQPPTSLTTLFLPQGTCYEMIDPDDWHDVVPVTGPVLSVMVTDRPWTQTFIVKPPPQSPLTEDQFDELYTTFRNLIGSGVGSGGT